MYSLFGGLVPGSSDGTAWFILLFKEEVPGASPKDCGNYLDMNLGMANYLAARFLDNVLYRIDETRLVYPE